MRLISLFKIYFPNSQENSEKRLVTIIWHCMFNILVSDFLILRKYDIKTHKITEHTLMKVNNSTMHKIFLMHPLNCARKGKENALALFFIRQTRIYSMLEKKKRIPHFWQRRNFLKSVRISLVSVCVLVYWTLNSLCLYNTFIRCTEIICFINDIVFFLCHSRTFF